MRRKGFTLIEVLTAVFIINVGLLALVAGSAMVVRQTNAARVRSTALRSAANRLEQLAAFGCRANAGSATAADGTHEVWWAEPLHNATRELVDSVAYVAGGVQSSRVLRTRVVC